MATAHTTYDLHSFGLKEMIHAGRALRRMDSTHTSMESAATGIIDFFHDRFRCEHSPESSNCLLARCFKTHAFGDLPPAVQQKAAMPAPSSGTQCLTLLASRGQQPEWNSRHDSVSHHAVPLATVAAVKRLPMIHQLILQLGLTPERIVYPAAHPREGHRTFDVFHVEHAHDSPMVPDQQHFVHRHGVASVLGFGGLLSDGELFVVILFTRVPVSPETALLFRTVALTVKLCLLPFSGKNIFAESQVC